MSDHPFLRDEDNQYIDHVNGTITMPLDNFSLIRKNQDSLLELLAAQRQELEKAVGFSLMRKFQERLKPIPGVTFAEADGMVLRFSEPTAGASRRWKLTLERD
jgi:hypothetical protein